MNRKSAALSVLVAILICSLSNPVLAQDTDEAKAKFHYKVALKAMESGDYATAEEQLQEAAVLLPGSAAIFYNLAVVQEKLAKYSDALQNVRLAVEKGLTNELKIAADELLVTLTAAQAAAERSSLQVLRGTWYSERSTESYGCNTHITDNLILMESPSRENGIFVMRGKRTRGSRTTCPNGGGFGDSTQLDVLIRKEAEGGYIYEGVVRDCSEYSSIKFRDRCNPIGATEQAQFQLDGERWVYSETGQVFLQKR